MVLLTLIKRNLRDLEQWMLCNWTLGPVITSVGADP
jgi:hypothetical protein